MVTLQQVKDYLWITSNANDTRLQVILDGVISSVESYIGDYSYGTKTIQVKKPCDNYIGLMHINAEDITSINWITIDSADYMIQDDWRAYIKEIYKYLDSDFPSIEVVYVAGYNTTPDNIISIISEMVWFTFAKELGQVVASEKMWPRSVQYFWDGKTSEMKTKEFYNSLIAFIPSHLRFW